MMSFRNNKLKNLTVPMRIVRLLSKINEYKGKQALYYQQSPQVLKILKEVAIIQSTKASNSIEGIKINDRRLKDIINKKETLHNRSEEEIAGYRDVLDTIHTSYSDMPITPSVILQLHRDLYKFTPVDGGKWKNGDNIIEEAFLYIKTDEIDPLILICTFILDFLCIHPFNDGNGRMSRLLTLLLLYKSGYEVGRFISIEQIIEGSKESYYDTLYKSSEKWHEGNHDIFPWIEYLLGVIIAAYKDFENRVGVVSSEKESKSQRVENTIEHFVTQFSKEDIRKACPDIAESTINRVLVNMRKEGKITPTGSGRNAKWQKLK